MVKYNIMLLVFVENLENAFNYSLANYLQRTVIGGLKKECLDNYMNVFQ